VCNIADSSVDYQPHRQVRQVWHLALCVRKLGGAESAMHEFATAVFGVLELDMGA
jgi:hypothetical protein